MTEAPALLRTPLYERHVALGARMVPFAGWEMPVQYAATSTSTRPCAARPGLFDLSHMGEVAGVRPGAAAVLDYALAGDLSALELGQAQYSMLLRRRTAASSTTSSSTAPPTRATWSSPTPPTAGRRSTSSRARAAGDFDATVDDERDEIALIALQGPRAAGVARLARPTLDLAALGHYASRARHGRRRAGADRAHRLHRRGRLRAVRRDARRATARCGRRCSTPGETRARAVRASARRDTLRLEAGMPLYGHELDRRHYPYEAGLGRVVKLDKGDFIGRAALAAVQQAGPARKLVGLVMREQRRRPPRLPGRRSTARRQARSPAARTRRRSASRSRWPTCRPRPHRRHDVEVVVRGSAASGRAGKAALLQAAEAGRRLTPAALQDSRSRSRSAHVPG